MKSFCPDLTKTLGDNSQLGAISPTTLLKSWIECSLLTSTAASHCVSGFYPKKDKVVLSGFFCSSQFCQKNTNFLKAECVSVFFLIKQKVGEACEGVLLFPVKKYSFKCPVDCYNRRFSVPQIWG